MKSYHPQGWLCFCIKQLHLLNIKVHLEKSKATIAKFSLKKTFLNARIIQIKQVRYNFRREMFEKENIFAHNIATVFRLNRKRRCIALCSVRCTIASD